MGRTRANDVIRKKAICDKKAAEYKQAADNAAKKKKYDSNRNRNNRAAAKDLPVRLHSKSGPHVVINNNK
jgi:hypothetical protein